MIKHILAIAAGKGGVGKSTVAVNLALAWKRRGMRVGLLDADLYGPSIRHMLHEEVLPSQAPEDSSRILPAIGKGIPYISMAFFRKEQEASILRAPIANSAISQFLHSVVWGDLDILLVDFPPGTGDIQLTLAQQGNLSGAILVTLPQELSLIDVRKAAQLFEQTHIPILGIVENMHGLFPGNAAATFSQETGCPILGHVSFDPVLCKTSDRGQDLFAEHSEAPSAKAFMELAQTMDTILGAFSVPVDDVQFALQDPAHLRLEWRDGLVKEISFADLQAHCPCVRCREKPKQSEGDVLADKVVNRGRYAMSVQYRTGCSKGIYPLEMLRAWRNAS